MPNKKRGKRRNGGGVTHNPRIGDEPSQKASPKEFVPLAAETYVAEYERLAQQYGKEYMPPQIITKLFHLDLAPCSRKGKKKTENCQENPQCTAGLGEQELLDLDASEPHVPHHAVLAELERGQAPAPAPAPASGDGELVCLPPVDGGKPSAQPGLRNLGATCYLNAVLQSLYAAPALRAAIYAAAAAPAQAAAAPATPPQASANGDDRSGVGALASLFATLQTGAGQVHALAPARLVDALRLTRTVQQDAHELLRLLLDYVEARAPAPARAALEQLAAGRLHVRVTCGACGGGGEGSEQPWAELELAPAAGVTSVEAGLARLVADDPVDAFRCEKCGKLGPAVRRTRLLAAPRLLVAHVLRFVYEPAKGTRRKLAHAVDVPLSLDLAPHMAADAPPGPRRFRLLAAVLHLGAQATGGHYIAHVRHAADAWLQLDDDTVRPVPAHHVAVPLPAADKPVPPPPAGALAEDGEGAAAPGRMRSKAAYLLFYEPDEDAPAPPLPSPLATAAQAELSRQAERAAKYQATRALLLDALLQRATLYREWVRVAAPPARSADAPLGPEDGVWVPVTWLRAWLRGDAPGPLTAKQLLCVHGLVPHAALPLMKRLAAPAYQILRERFGGELPAVASASCNQCARGYLLDRLALLTKARAKHEALHETPPAGAVHAWVSRSLLAEFKRRFPYDWEEADALLLAGDLRCEHGQLSADESARVQVPPKLAALLGSLLPPEYGPIPAAGADVCALCVADNQQQAVVLAELRALKAQDKKQLAWLLSEGKASAHRDLAPQTPYRLLSYEWLLRWKRFVEQPGEEQLPKLEQAAFMCPHGLLRWDPLAVNLGRTEPAPPPPFLFLEPERWRQLEQRLRELGSFAGPEIVFCPADGANQPLHVQRKGAATSGGGGNRRSRRRNRAASVLEASSSDTVHQIKLKIMQVTEVPPICQRVYFHDTELADDEQPISHYGIGPNDILLLDEIPEEEIDFSAVAGSARHEGEAFEKSSLSSWRKKEEKAESDEEDDEDDTEEASEMEVAERTASPMQSDRPAPAQSSTPDQASPAAMELDKWKCPSCTLENPISKSSCDACDTPSPVAKPKPQQPKGATFWECTKCTFQNNFADKACEMCKTLREPASRRKLK